MKPKLRIVLFLSVSGAIGFLSLLLSLSNLLATEKEKPIEREFQAFLEHHPRTELNDSARKLNELFDALIKNAGNKTSTSPELASEKRQDFYNIESEISEFLEAQLEKPTGDVDSLPANVQEYLQANATEIAAIRGHIINSELPTWEWDVRQMLAPHSHLPRLLGVTQIQKILLIDLLEKNRLKSTPAMVETLEASWKLTEAVRQKPNLVNQLVAIIMVRWQAGVLRKLENLPPEWQQRVMEYDYSEAVLTAIAFESWLNYHTIRNLPDLLDSNDEVYTPFPRFLLRFSHSYFRLAAVDTVETTKKALATIRLANFCAFDLDRARQGQIDFFAGWNVAAEVTTPDLLPQWQKGAERMLTLELTQKILQAKALAATQGRWPDSLPGLESQVCPDARWLYQVGEDGTMSLSFSEELQWRKRDDNNRYLPLTYTAPARK